MIKNFFYKIIATHDKRRLLENIFSLSVLQIANYILPLITLPYLVRVLGAEKFGLISFAGAFIQYFVVLTEYGFGLSGTRQVSINRYNQQKLSLIISSIFFLKVIFLMFSALVLAGLLFYIPKFRVDWLVYVITFGIVLENVVFPVWFYQGVEDMKYITIRNLGAKIFFTIMLFICVRESDDYLYVPLLNSMGMIVAGLFGLIPLFTKYKISFKKPTYKECIEQIQEAWHLFTSRLFINIYTTSNTVILGLFASNEIVGYYSAALKLYNAIQSMTLPVATTLFPYFAKKINDDRENAILQFRKLFRYTLSFTFLISCLLFLFSPFIVQVLLGKNYEKSILILRILSGVIFFGWNNYTLGIQGLVNFGYKEIFSKYVILAGIFHMIVILITTKAFGYLSVPIVWFFTETILFIFEYKFLKSKKVLLSCWKKY